MKVILARILTFWYTAGEKSNFAEKFIKSEQIYFHPI